jgi:phage terminase small subunit
MKRKEKAFVQAIIDNPRISNGQAVIDAGYDVAKRATASVIANELLKKPEIVSALQDYVELTESAITQTVRDWKDSSAPQERAIAMQNAQYIHDKVFGKATQKIETHNVSLTFGMDLSGAPTS